MMIAREWRGATESENRPAQLEYLKATGLKEYFSHAGLGVLVLTRDARGGTEFLLLSFWKDMESLSCFAGPEPDKAVFCPEDERFVIAKHLEARNDQVAFEMAVSEISHFFLR